MIVGITGTRDGMSAPQRKWFCEYLSTLDVTTLHHGGCVGVDRDAHLLATARGIPVVVHPPENQRLAALDTLVGTESVTVLPAKDYLARDRDIVDESDLVIGFPDGPQRPRSGTWYTIGYARDTSVPSIVCMPDCSLL